MRIPLTIASAALMTACASAPPEKSAPAPEVAVVEPAAPRGPAVPEPPWLFLEWGSAIVVSDTLHEGWLEGDPVVDDDGYQAERKLASAPELAAARALVGTEMKVLSREGGDCTVRVTSLVGLSWADPEEDDLSELYPNLDEQPEPTEAQRAAILWRVGRKVLAARYEWIGEGCDGPLLTAPVTSLPRTLTSQDYGETKPDPAIIAKARALVRQHSLWDVQEDAYQESIALAKKHRTKLREQGYYPELKGVPKHWDEPMRGEAAEWTDPSLQTWTDSSGKALFHVLEIGNRVSCGAPRAWFLVDGEVTEILRFGLGWPPEAIFDFGNDGTWDVAYSSYMETWVETLSGSGEPTVLRQSAPLSAHRELHCAWEQVPPVAVIEEALKPRPPEPNTD